MSNLEGIILKLEKWLILNAINQRFLSVTFLLFLMNVMIQ